MNVIESLPTISDQPIKLKVVDQENDSTPITDATVTMTLFDSKGDAVTNANNLTMTHDAAGVYEVTLPYTLGIDKNAQYEAVFTVIASGWRATRYKRFSGAYFYI